MSEVSKEFKKMPSIIKLKIQAIFLNIKFIWNDQSNSYGWNGRGPINLQAT